MKAILIAFIFLISIICSLTAQTIRFNFPYFAGVPYVFYLIQGDKNDTIVRDVIPEDGKFKIEIPERHKGYAGMSRWMLTHRDGGGLDLIINGEDFSVECLEAAPSVDNIEFKGTVENIFFRKQYIIQQELLRKIDAMQMAVESYSVSDKLFPVFKKELDSLKRAFEEHQRSIAESPLYAARFRQIADFTMGIADKLYDSERERALSLNRFIVEELDWRALYTSNHWSGVINNWVEMNIYAIGDDNLLINSTKMILKRLPDKKLYTDFLSKLTRNFIRNSKDDLIAELRNDVRSSGMLLHSDGMLAIYDGLYPGDKAMVPEGLNNPKSAFKTGAVLIFYETGCQPCEIAKKPIIKNYDVIAKKGVRVISISADKDKDQHLKSIAKLPWSDKLCDFKGFNGSNFKNYGVLATPTILLVDKNGIITGRYADIDIDEILNAF